MSTLLLLLKVPLPIWSPHSRFDQGVWFSDLVLIPIDWRLPIFVPLGCPSLPPPSESSSSISQRDCIHI